MTAVALDDISSTIKPKKKGKKVIPKAGKTVKVTPTSTAKKAKSAKAVAKPLRAKKNKTKELPTEFDRDSIFDGLPTHNKQGKELPVPRAGVPSQSDDIAKQLEEALIEIPSSVQRDNEQFQEFLTMFRQCQLMSRSIERRFHERQQPKDVYPLLKLYEQMREIIADLRAIKDVTELGTVIVDEVLAPMSESMATELIGYHQQVIKWLNANVAADVLNRAKFDLQEQLKKHAKAMQMGYEASVGKVSNLLTEESA